MIVADRSTHEGPEYEAGFRARRAELPFTANPHKPSALAAGYAHAAWLQGWRDADEFYAVVACRI